jgi:hypothetical protein
MDSVQQGLEAYESARESIAGQVRELKDTFIAANSKETVAQKVGEGLSTIGGTTGSLVGTYIGVKHLLATLGTKGAETKSAEEVAEDNAGEAGGEGAATGGEAAAEAPAAVEMTTFREATEVEDVADTADLPTEGISEAALETSGEGIGVTTFGATTETTVLANDVAETGATVGNSMSADIANATLETPADAAATGSQSAIAAADPEGVASAVSTATTGGEAAAAGGEAAAGGGGAAAATGGGEAAAIGGEVAAGGAAAPETLGLSLVGAAIVAGITALVGTLTKEFGGKKARTPPTPDVMTIGPNISHDPEGNVPQGLAF